MIRIELKLFGKPRLLVNGQQVNPGRPTVFEILAKVIMSGEAGIRRGELAAVMWPDLDQSKGRANLRVSLANLRVVLDGLGITDQIYINDDVLRTHGGIDVDVKNFLANAASLADLRHAVQPVAKGWESERWQAEADAVASCLANGFQAIADQLSDDEHCSLLKTAVRSHPTSTQLTTLLLSIYKSSNKIDEANQIILDFENAWINRFGTADLPKLRLKSIPVPSLPSVSSANSVTQDPSSHFKQQKQSKIIALAAVSILVLFVATAVFSWGLKRNLSGSSMPTLEVTLVENYSKSINGIEFSLRKFKVANVRSDQLKFKSISNIDFVVQGEETLPALITRDTKIQPFANDIDKSSLGIAIGPSVVLTGFVARGAINQEFRPIPGYPFFCDPSILSNGTLLLDRYCAHPFADHRRLSHFYDGSEHIVGPEGELPQVVVSTSITDKTVYGQYSYGRKEGWRNHTFGYDIRSRTFKKLNIPPVKAALDSNLLVCRPETTTVLNGDYDTHPTGDVMVVDQVSGKQLSQHWANGQAPTMLFLPPYIIKPKRMNDRSSSLQFLNGELKLVTPFPEFKGNFCRFEELSSQMLLLVPFHLDHFSREFWIVTRKDPV